MRTPPDLSLLHTYGLKARGLGASVIIGLLLGVLALIDGWLSGSGSGDGLPCRVQVRADLLDVRGSPDPGARSEVVLHRGDVRGAQNTVENGYRGLGDGWALDRFLRPLPASGCTSR